MLPTVTVTYNEKTTEMIEEIEKHLMEYEKRLATELSHANIHPYEKYRLYSSDKYRMALRDRIAKIMAMAVPKIVVHVDKEKCQHSISPTNQ